jgi:hypothetical protein
MDPSLGDALSNAANLAGHWIVAHPYELFIIAVVVILSSRYLPPAVLIKDLRKGIQANEYDVIIVGGGNRTSRWYCSSC